MSWTEKYREAVRHKLTGLEEHELDYVEQICERTGLDVLTNQLHVVKRWDGKARKHVLQVAASIEGCRLVAERTGKYESQDPIEFWDDEHGCWAEVWTSDDPPTAARASICKRDCRHPTRAVVHWRSFVQYTKDGSANKFWRDMGEHMIGITAERHALRKAFPQELAGIAGDDHYLEPPNQPGESAEQTSRQTLDFIHKCTLADNLTELQTLREEGAALPEKEKHLGIAAYRAAEERFQTTQEILDSDSPLD